MSSFALKLCPPRSFWQECLANDSASEFGLTGGICFKVPSSAKVLDLVSIPIFKRKCSVRHAARHKSKNFPLLTDIQTVKLETTRSNVVGKFGCINLVLAAAPPPCIACVARDADESLHEDSLRRDRFLEPVWPPEYQPGRRENLGKQ